jgi:neutral trehalase
VKVLSGFLPLYAGIPDINRADKMMEYLNTASFCRLDKECFAAPSYDKKSADYSTQKYWRGPIWMNLNWLICIGLAKYEKSEYSERILNTIIELPMKEGFYEYYDPETGDGYGSEHFAWTAALLIDALYIHQKRKESA